MKEQLEPIACYLASHTLNFLEPILDKYKRLSSLFDTTLEETLQKGMSAILTRQNFLFNKILVDINFNYELTIHELKDEFFKIADLKLKGKAVSYTFDHIIIDDKKFSHDSFDQLFEDQNLFIEYIALALLYKQLGYKDKALILEKENGKVYISLQVASKASRISRRQIQEYASNEGYLIYSNPKTGECLISQQDLENLVLKAKTTGIDFLV